MGESRIWIVKSLAEINAPYERLIPALDYYSWAEAQLGLSQMTDYVGGAKVNSLADVLGAPQAGRAINAEGFLSVLDYKVFDVPETMRRRARAFTLANFAMFTVHAAADEEGLRATVAGVEEALALDPSLRRPLVLGVTVLTSFGETNCVSIFGANREQKSKEFARMAAYVGLDGMVSSAREARKVKAIKETEHLKVLIPAVRPAYAPKKHDQYDISSVAEAIESGADWITVGRPLTEAESYGLTPREGAIEISLELAEAS